MGLNFQRNGVDLEYVVMGRGPTPMLAFHGFGNDAEMFSVLTPSLENRYTIYSFNLPFHGKSTVSENFMIEGIQPEQFRQYISGFLEHLSADKFSVMGYSIGGKIAMKLIELMPEKIRDVFLFAPDGIKPSPWYKFVTGTMLGRIIFSRMMKYPGRYAMILRLLESIRLVRPHTANFVRASLDSHDKQKLVFKTWMCLRRLDPDIRKTQDLINTRKLNFHIFFGRYDKVIPYSAGQKFISRLKNDGALHLINSGHFVVKEDLNVILAKIS